MTIEQREKIIEKILSEHDNESLFEILKLDWDIIFSDALNSKTDNELLEIIL
jgi:hypothetical protein